MLTQYTASGKIGALTIPIVVPAALAAALLGVVETALVTFIPLVILGALITMMAAAGLFAVTRWFVMLGKCRSAAMGALIGVAAAAACVAAGHLALFLWEIRNLPPDVHATWWDFVQFRVQTGWTIGKTSTGMPVTGVGVWIVWGAEALLFLGAGLLGGRSAAREPFCEPCDRWANKVAHEFALPGLSDQTIDRMKTAADLETFLTPPLEEIRPADRELSYKVRACPSCDRAAFLDIAVKTTTFDKNGKPQTSTTALGSTVVLTPEEAAAVGQLKDDVREITAKGARA